MRATGIVRRMDELGRVVIPKEIRRACGIRENDPFEIFVETSDGKPMICFRKYEVSFVGELTTIADRVDDEMMYSATSGQRSEVRKHFNEIAKILKEWEKI